MSVLSVADARKCPMQILSEMAESDNAHVRMVVALNPQTDKTVLAKLCSDQNADVRYMLASSSYLPVFLLWKLRNDENPHVQWRAELTLRKLGVVK